ncbi:hypothetical protein ACWGZ8_23210 (plasmid) [Xanthomonas axonopodis pv. khayae]
MAEDLPEHEPGLVDLAAQHDARLLERDEAFTGDVAQHVEHDQGGAYVIEADGDRVMVPQVVTSTFNLTHFSNFKLTHLS